MERKLTAILSADVKGYSRLMGEDEEATIRTLTAYREVMTTLIGRHRGRVVDSPGDNLLAEFASVVNAVQGAVEIQRELELRNADLPHDLQHDVLRRRARSRPAFAPAHAVHFGRNSRPRTARVNDWYDPA